MIEIYAAVVGAFVGVAGTGAVMSWANSSSRNAQSRETVVRLATAVESIAGKLEELHQDMRADRKEIYTKLNEHGQRITVLENKGR